MKTPAVIGLSAALICCALPMTSACAPDASQDAPDPYAAEFQRAKAEAKSEFEREVLSDSKITAEEYSEARQRFSLCMNDRGFDVKSDNSGGYTIVPENSEEDVNQAMQECGEGTVNKIEPLYNATITNPKNEDFDNVVARCLVRHGIAPKGFSGEDLAELQAGGPLGQVGPGEEASLPPATTPAPQPIPGGGDLNSPEAQECFVAPQK